MVENRKAEMLGRWEQLRLTARSTSKDGYGMVRYRHRI